MTEEIRQKIERWKILCEDLLEENKDIFIKFLDGSLERWSSVKILSVGEKNLYVESFKGNNVGTKFKVRWINIIKLVEYEVNRW